MVILPRLEVGGFYMLVERPMNEMPPFNLEKLNVTIEGKEQGMLTAITNQVYRARVPDGWLVFAGHNGGLAGVTFYPDADHRWRGEG